MVNKSDYIKIWPTEETLGVTYNMIRAAHTEKEYLNFCKWMCGQTCGMMDNGDAAIYAHDYIRWLKQGMKTCQNAEDWD